MPNQPAIPAFVDHWIRAIDHDALSERWNPPPLPLREPFGAWLLAQRDRGDWIDDLAAAARADRAFPRRADPEQVRDRLHALGADGDVFEQLDDAERMWRSL